MTQLKRTAYDIVRKALSLLRVTDPQLPLDPDVGEIGFDALNDLVKHLQNQGFHIWTEREAILPLIKDRQSYKIGVDGDHIADDEDFKFLSTSQISSNLILNVVGDIDGAPNILPDSPTESTQDWVATDATLTSDGETLTVTNNSASSGRSSYSIETTPNTTYVFTFKYTKGTSAGANFIVNDVNGDFKTINLTLDTETTLEFTARQNQTNFVIENTSTTSGQTSLVSQLNYVDKSKGDRIAVLLNDKSFFWTNVVFYENNRATLADRLPEEIPLGTKVYSYSNLLDKPMSITNIRFRENQGFSDIPTTQWSRKEYFEQTNKDSRGTVTKWYYSRRIDDVRLYVWQTAASNEQLAYISYIQPTEITTTNAQEVDFPSEYFKTLYYLLAVDLIPEFAVPDQRAQVIEAKAQEFLDDAMGFDNGDTYIQLMPDHVNR